MIIGHVGNFADQVERMSGMFMLWKKYRARKRLSGLPQPEAAKLDSSSETKSEKPRLSDVAGKLRRLRQVAENNRLL